MWYVVENPRSRIGVNLRWRESGHPKAREGEVFLRNMTEADFGELHWKTKRKEHCAYDVSGNRIGVNGSASRQFRAVFIGLSEWLETEAPQLRDDERRWMETDRRLKPHVEELKLRGIWPSSQTHRRPS